MGGEPRHNQRVHLLGRRPLSGAVQSDGARHECHLCFLTGAISIHGNSGSGHQAPCLTCPMCLLVHPSVLIFLVNAQISGRVFLVFIGRNNHVQMQTVEVGVQREYGAGMTAEWALPS